MTNDPLHWFPKPPDSDLRPHAPLSQVPMFYKAGSKYPPVPAMYEGDVGIDVAAANDHHLAPGDMAWVEGGYDIELPSGWMALVLPRSSSNRRGLLVMAGVIDNGYTGNIGAQVINLSGEWLHINQEDRIAQVVLFRGYRIVPVEVSKFTPTDRGGNGWGSSG